VSLDNLKTDKEAILLELYKEYKKNIELLKRISFETIKVIVVMDNKSLREFATKPELIEMRNIYQVCTQLAGIPKEEANNFKTDVKNPDKPVKVDKARRVDNKK